jgi:hypothetical protein
VRMFDPMKGNLFIHAVEFAQNELGTIEVERILSALNFESKAVYTAVGMYQLEEFLALQVAFANRMNIAPDEFSHRLGLYALPEMLKDHGPDVSEHPFDYLERVHGHIHHSVRKIYPMSRPPDVEVIERDGTRSLKLRYVSRRPLAAFCGGMLEAALRSFNRWGDYTFERVDPEPRTETYAEFRVFERRIRYDHAR